MQFRSNIKCAKHPCYDKVYFCLGERCQKSVCPDCYLDEHSGHPKKSLEAAYEERKRQVNGVVETLDEQVKAFTAKEIDMAAKVAAVKDQEVTQLRDIRDFSRLMNQSVKEELMIK